MTKIYRTVPVKDEGGVKGRLPEKDGYYITILENNLSESTLFNGCYFVYDEYDDPVTHWLEEVKMPSEKDKKDMMASIHLDNYQRRIFESGAKWIRDLIFKNK